MVVSLTADELQQLVENENANCTQLGVHLDISLDRLHVLEKQSMTKRSPTVCFMEMCQLWLKKDEKDKKWSVVFKALEQQRNRRLKKQLEDLNYKKDDTGTCKYTPK